MILLFGGLLLASFAVLRRRFIVVAVTLGVGMLAPSLAAAEPSGTVSFSVGSETWVGQPLSITVSGASSQAGELAVYMFEGSSTCPSVQHKEEVNLGDIAPPTPVSAGSYSQTYSVTAEDPAAYMLCGYLYDPSNSDAIYASGTGSFTASYRVTVVKSPGVVPPANPPTPSPTAVYPANGGTVPYADRRMVFAWRGGYLSEAVLLFRTAPTAGVTPFRTLGVLGDEAVFADAGVRFDAGQEKAPLNEALPAGRYFWQVQADSNGPTPAISSVFSFTVVPPLLTLLRVDSRRVYGLTASRPGKSVLGVDVTPYATVFVTVRHAGHVVARTTYPSDPSPTATFRYRWTCRRAGSTSYEVIARDAYGHRMTRVGRWMIPTCAAVTARARRLSRDRGGVRAGGGGGSGTCSSDGIVFTWSEASCSTAERLWRTFGTNGVTPAGWYCGGDRYTGGCDTAGVSGVVVGAKYVSWHQQ